MLRNPVLCAIDTTDRGRARAIARAVAPHVGGLKLGLEFFCAHGPDAVREAAAGATELFLDLKLHDIPNTVAGAVRAVAPLRPAILTVHAAGGREMMRAAADAAGEHAVGMKVIAVTVLTSLDEGDLDSVGQRGPVAEQVRRLAALAQESGLDGVVCSPHEVEVLRHDRGPGFLLVVPGIRPAGVSRGDQKRVMTPVEAIRAGADRLVIGRPIAAASDPAAAAAAIAQELGR